MSLRPVSERLSLEMLKAVTKSLDTNRNNRIEEYEVDFRTYRTLREASRDANGYANDIVGTTEMARAIQSDRVTLTSLPPAVADRIANALTNGDAWVSREDFGFTEQARERLDRNGDKRISRAEMSQALQNGTIEVGSSFMMDVRSYEPPTPPPYIPPSDYAPTPPPSATRNSP